MIKIKDNGRVDARDLHQLLDSKKSFPLWIKKKLKGAYLQENKDYTKWVKTPIDKGLGGRPSTEYELTLNGAENICLIQQTERGREIRDYLLSLHKQVENNEMLSLSKASLLVHFLNTFKYAEFQMEAEDMHRNKFVLSTKTRENVHALFYNTRNDILGIDKKTLANEVLKAYNNNLTHKATGKNQRERLALIDKYELVRCAVADYLIATGTSQHNATTFAQAVKEVAKETNLQIRIKDEDNLFQTKENAISPDLLELKGIKLIA